MVIGWKLDVEPALRDLKDESTYELFDINMSLHGLIYTQKKTVHNPNLIVQTQQQHLDDDGEWLAWDHSDGGGKKKASRKRS